MTATAVSVKLTDDEKARLAKLSRDTKQSAHFHMRAAINAYLEEQEWRRSFIAEAEAAWKDYKETGLHVTLEEMQKWAEDPSQELPECHT